MNFSFQAVSQAPTVKVADLASFKACLAAYEEHIARMVALYGASIIATASPSPPSLSLPAMKGGAGEKGEWEREWLKRTGRKSVRMTDKVKERFSAKEDYCKALCEGEEEGEEEEVNAESVASVPPLF